METLRNSRAICLAAGVACLAAPVAAQSGWTTTCVEGDRCTALLSLADAATGRSFGSLGLQIGKGAADPVLIVLSPLGVAVRPGARAVIGAQTFEVAFDVCYPDGCRATAQLADADLETWLSAETASLQFFPYSSDKPVAADAPLGGLRDALADMLASAP